MNLVILISASVIGFFLTGVGMVSFGEIMLSGLGLAMILHGLPIIRLGAAQRKFVLIFLCLGAVQAAADFIDGTAPEDSIKGVGAYLIVGFSIFTICRVFKDRPNAAYRVLMVGCISMAAHMIVARIGYGFPALWKSYFAFLVCGGLMCALMLYSPKTVVRSLTAAIFLACAVISIYSDFRAAFGIFMMCALYAATSNTRFWRKMIVKAARLSTWAVGLWIIGLVVVINYAGSLIFQEVLSEGILNGVVGATQLDKYAAQAGGEYGILIGGRTEIIGALQAFLDSPLTGHGSWPVDPGKYTALIDQFRTAGGYSDSTPDIGGTQRYIPTHSHMLQGFVWSGIFGGLLWFVLFVNLISNGISVLKAGFGGRSVVILFFVVTAAWNILFSPFGYQSRFWLVAVFSIVAIESDLVRKRLADKGGELQ